MNKVDLSYHVNEIITFLASKQYLTAAAKAFTVATILAKYFE